MTRKSNTYGSSRMRGLLSAALVVAASAICVGNASAAYVERSDDDSELLYVAKIGLENDVTVTLDNGLYVFTDPSDTISTPDNECDSINAHTAKCPADPNNFPPVDEIRVLVFDQDDTVHNNTAIEATIFGDSGNDNLYGGLVDDYISGGAGLDHLYGSFGKDSMHGDAGNDTLAGSFGNDHLDGGTDTDTLDGGGDSDHIIGGGDLDAATYTTRVNAVYVNTASEGSDGEVAEDDDVEGDVEVIVGGSNNDILTGNGSNNYLVGGAGEDSLYGADGDDGIYGGSAKDTVYGGQGSDTLYGDAGNDLLKGEGGDDSLYGQQGHDILGGESGNDTVLYVGENQPLSIDLGGDDYDDGVVGDEDMILSDVENVTGGNNDDTIVGDDETNVLRGGKGNDTLDGHGGADSIFGDDGDDSLLSADVEADDADNCGAGNDDVTADFGDTIVDCETQDIQSKPVENGNENGQGAPSSGSGNGPVSTAGTGSAVVTQQGLRSSTGTTKTAKKITVRVKSIRIKGGKARVKVLCSSAARRCIGKLTLKSKSGKRLVTKSIKITSGKTATITLSRKATRALKRTTRVAVSIRVNADSQTATQSTKLRVS